MPEKKSNHDITTPESAISEFEPTPTFDESSGPITLGGIIRRLISDELLQTKVFDHVLSEREVAKLKTEGIKAKALLRALEIMNLRSLTTEEAKQRDRAEELTLQELSAQPFWGEDDRLVFLKKE